MVRNSPVQANPNRDLPESVKNSGSAGEVQAFRAKLSAATRVVAKKLGFESGSDKLQEQLDNLLDQGEFPKNLYKHFDMRTMKFNRATLSEYVGRRRKSLSSFKIIPDVYREETDDIQIKAVGEDQITSEMYILRDNELVKHVGWSDSTFYIDRKEENISEYINNKKETQTDYVNMRSSTTQKNTLTFTNGAVSCIELLIKADGNNMVDGSEKPSKGIIYHISRMDRQSAIEQLDSEIRKIKGDGYQISVDIQYGEFAKGRFFKAETETVLQIINDNNIDISSEEVCEDEKILGFIIDDNNKIVKKTELCVLKEDNS